MFTQLVSTEDDFFSLRLMPLMRDKFIRPAGVVGKALKKGRLPCTAKRALGKGV